MLIGDGTNFISSTPTFPNTAATTGKILIADGTNFVASTPTYPNSATGTGKLLRADGTNFVVTTSTYPDTNAVSTLLYASATNVMSALATANNGTFVTSATGVPSILAGPGTTGNILQSNAAAAPSYSTSTYPATNAVNTLLYASSANVMAALATANSGVLSTSTSGVPSIDTTNFHVLSTGVQLKGNNANTAPPAGFIGEQIRSVVTPGSPVSGATTVVINITSIALTAGVWDVTGIACMNAAAITGTLWYAAISSASANLPANYGDDQVGTSYMATATSFAVQTIPALRVTLSGNTTYYLVSQATYTVGAATFFGRLSATRVG